MESLLLKPTDGSFLLWRCLHDGSVTRKNLDAPPDESRLPFQETAVALLKKLTELYGSAAILAWEGDEVVGLLRFVPKVVSQMEGGGGFCLLQPHPAGPKEDFPQGVFPSKETIEDRTLVVTCMQLLSDRQRKGIGRAMVERLKSWAREEGWEAIEATAYQDLPLVYEVTGNAGRNWWRGLGFHVRESLEEEAMKEYGEFLHALEIQAREKGMEPHKVTQKFIMRWETQATGGIGNQMRIGPTRA
jgi:GNAT superfamily N-acetyltransferase